MASKGQLLHSEGTSQGSQLIKRLKDLPGEDDGNFSSQRCQYLQGLISQVRKKWKAECQASLVSQTNGQNKSSGAKGIHLELKKARLRNSLGGQQRRQQVAATKTQPKELLQEILKQAT